MPKHVARLFATIVACIVLVGPLDHAYAELAGLQKYEYAGGWRGVYGRIWLYDWDLGPEQLSEHISSIYMRSGTTDKHVEVGIEATPWDYPNVFYQWCKVDSIDGAAWGVGWYQKKVALLSGSGYYTAFEINNVDMGGPGDVGDNWRFAYNGNVMSTVYIPGMIAAHATCSSEVMYPGLDDNRGSYRDMKKKNNSGSWSLWVNACDFPLYVPDYTHEWGSYSPSHWYTIAK